MEAAIRWSGCNQQDANRRFLIADVANNCIEFGEVEGIQNRTVRYERLSYRGRLPNFTAFDWSREDDYLVAIGTSIGECRIINIDPGRSEPDVFTLPVKLQRKCNSISFSRENLLAIGHDRIRGDSSLNIYDLASQNLEPTRRLTGAEVITNVKFFSDQPQMLVAGSGGMTRHGQCLKLFDLRESVATTAATIPTRHVHLISIDPLDENYFASSGPSSENALSIWDKRFLRLNSDITANLDTSAVLEIQSVLPPALQPGVWSLRYSGYRRGSFAVLSAGGFVRYLEMSNLRSDGSTPQPLFVKRSHNLNVPVGPQVQGTVARAIAFDHVSPGGLGKRDSVLTIGQNRELQVLAVPASPTTIAVSPLSEIIFSESSGVMTCSTKNLQQNHTPPLQRGENTTNERREMPGKLAKLSSRERHDRAQSLRLNPSEPSLRDALRCMDLQRQRCVSGYLFDCEKNMKIVQDDPWLVELWETVRRLNQMAYNRGMMHGGLDLSFFGVYDIWFADFGGLSHRLKRSIPSQEEFSRLIDQILASQSYGDFEGGKTNFPERRQLALAICGWKFDERRLQDKCNEIVDRGEYYKGIVVAVAHGRKDIAINLLRRLTRSKALENSGLAAVIAYSNISDEQRSLCDWMADEAEDPYLKAMLAYFISGTWRAVVDMTELPLQYRVAVALKHLNDDALGDFLTSNIQDVIDHGDTEGVVLTGLTETAIELFQNYIGKSCDLQTAVLALSFATPRLTSASQWEMWKASYFDQMQAWSAFMERTRFINQHKRRMKLGNPMSRQGSSKDSPDDKNLLLQCSHCQKPITRQQDTNAALFGSRKATQGLNDSDVRPDGAVCQRCGQPFSRCAICLHWQGFARGKQALPSESAMDNGFMSALVGFCIRCKHSFHVSHAKEWFAQHERCPVPDCSCSCNMGQGLARR